MLPPPRPAGPAREPRRPLTPAAGEEEGPRRRKRSRKRARRPRFPGEAAGGVVQPAGPGSRRRRLDGVSARRPESGGSPERAPGLRSPPLCLGFGRGRRPGGADGAPAEWLGGVAARVPPPVPCPRRPPTVCRGQTEKHRKRRMVGVRAEREDEPS